MVTSFSKPMTTNEKSTEVRLCVLLTPFAPWALSWATLLRWEEKNMVVATASEDPPTPLPAGAHWPWQHHSRKETQRSSQQSTGQSVESRSPVQSWHCLKQCWGLGGKMHSKAPLRESERGEAAHPAGMRGRAQTSCSGKQQNRQWEL